jgi:ATP-binding cassette subfamily B protein
LVVNGDSWMWSLDKLPVAIQALALAAGFPVNAQQLTAPSYDVIQSNSLILGRWMESAAQLLHLELEQIETAYGDLDFLLQYAGPVIIRVVAEGEPRFLLILGNHRNNSVLIIDSASNKIAVKLDDLRSTICEQLERPILPSSERLIQGLQLSRTYRARVMRALLREHLKDVQIRGCWSVRRSPGLGLLQQALNRGLGRLAFLFIGAHVAEYSIYLLSWYVIGRGALEGKIDHGWLIAWVVLLVSIVPFRYTSLVVAGKIAVEGGALLKQRLLAGSLNMNPDIIQREGAGKLLGLVIESEAVEALAISGGIAAITACIDLGFAGFVLGLGSSFYGLLVLFVAWLFLLLASTIRYFHLRLDWTLMRANMTDALVEKIIGHRTRKAQQPSAMWHEDEDSSLVDYLRASARLDQSHVFISAFIPRGWLLAGIVVIASTITSGSAGAGAIVVAIGGLLLVFRSLRILVSGAIDVIGALIAWKQVAPLLRAARKIERPCLLSLPMKRNDDPTHSGLLLEVNEIFFRHRREQNFVLAGCTLSLYHSEKILLTGKSGCGKSTLVSIIAGLRVPDQGLMLMEGLDRNTLGFEGWRQRVALAPQFHENHVLASSFAFNLLMGRRWPPRPGDLDEAEAVCRALNLGDLIDRMPEGLMTQIGENGWQLSHGERSRLYMARTLLQESPMIILDESFSALDPETFKTALQYIGDRARTLILVAHP